MCPRPPPLYRTAQGWYGAACDEPCYAGESAGRLCVCRPGWAAPDCSRQCAGGAATPCTGHGACNATHMGDGTCTCDAGWRGPACAVPCAGLLTTGRPCGGHGVCRGDGTCDCVSGADGHWAGEACAAGYVGPGCRLECPAGGAARLPCGGHGACVAGPYAAACECYTDTRGQWDPRRNCSDCAAGHWGPQCRGVCPGGTCAPCYGHGRCWDGLEGAGGCMCDARWAAPDCANCQWGYVGPDCAMSCASAGAKVPVLCGGHGLCEYRGPGVSPCICLRDAVDGYWDGPDCTECLGGF